MDGSNRRAGVEKKKKDFNFSQNCSVAGKER